jgi:signal recognition particle receptor subunit beta
MVSVATEHNRTISFDFLPLNAMPIGEYSARFQLYTVPGQKIMRHTRKAVLTGADAIVFVADSSSDRLESNLSSLSDTRECLLENGIDPDSIPVVFQFNKRDLPGAMHPSDLDELLGVRTASFLACAKSGYQVFATLDEVTRMILQGFSVSSVEGKTAETPPDRLSGSPQPVAMEIC